MAVMRKTNPATTKNKAKIKDIFILQAVFIFFSFSHIASKSAQQVLASFDSFYEAIFSFRFILAVAIVVFILAVYALMWQQVIKRFDLSIAYANKATTLLWGLVWGYFLFGEVITLTKAAGVFVVFIGVIILNSEAIS